MHRQRNYLYPSRKTLSNHGKGGLESFLPNVELLTFFLRPYGTVTLLSALMAEVIKDLMAKSTDEELWSWVARDILLDTWTVLLTV